MAKVGTALVSHRVANENLTRIFRAKFLGQMFFGTPVQNELRKKNARNGKANQGRNSGANARKASTSSGSQDES